MALDMDRFWDASIEFSMVVVGSGLFVLTALTSARHGPGKWKYPPIIAGALVVGLVQYLGIAPSWPEASVFSFGMLATLLLLGSLTCCLILDYRLLFKWIRGRNRLSLSYKAILSVMCLIGGLLVSSWVIHVSETVFMVRADRQARRILDRSR